MVLDSKTVGEAPHLVTGSLSQRIGCSKYPGSFFSRVSILHLSVTLSVSFAVGVFSAARHIFLSKEGGWLH